MVAAEYADQLPHGVPGPAPVGDLAAVGPVAGVADRALGAGVDGAPALRGGVEPLHLVPGDVGGVLRGGDQLRCRVGLVGRAGVPFDEGRGGRRPVDGGDELVGAAAGDMARLVDGPHLVVVARAGLGQRAVGVRRGGGCRELLASVRRALQPPVDPVVRQVHLPVPGPGELGRAGGGVVRNGPVRRGEGLDLVVDGGGARRVGEPDVRGTRPVDVVEAERVLALGDRHVDRLLDGGGDVLPHVDLADAIEVDPHAVPGGGREREGATGAEVARHRPAHAEVVGRHSGYGRARAPVLVDRGIAVRLLRRARERRVREELPLEDGEAQFTAAEAGTAVA